MPAERSSGERTAGALTSQAAARASGQLPAGAKPRRQHAGGRGCFYAAASPLPERRAVGRAPSAASRAYAVARLVAAPRPPVPAARRADAAARPVTPVTPRAAGLHMPQRERA